MAGLRLTKIGAKVSYKKSIFKKPIKVEGPQDWRDPTSKKAKIVDHPVWLVSIDLPIKYITQGLEGIEDTIQQDLEKTNAEIVDAYGTTDQSVSDDSEPPSDESFGDENI